MAGEESPYENLDVGYFEWPLPTTEEFTAIRFLTKTGVARFWNKIKDKFVKIPSGGTAGQALVKTDTGIVWGDITANQASTLARTTDISNVIAPIIMRENLTDNEALDFKQFYPEWTVGFDYKQNWIIRYGEDLYRIGQDHTSQEQWVPGTVGTEALYSKIEITEE